MEKLCSNCGMSIKAKSKWTKKDYSTEFDKLKELFTEYKESATKELEEATQRGYALGREIMDSLIQEANDDTLSVANEAWKQVIDEVKKHELQMVGGSLPSCKALEIRVFEKLNS